MAKKAVAGFRASSAKTYAKVIKAVKSEKSGAYMFKEEMVPVDMVQEALKKI